MCLTRIRYFHLLIHLVDGNFARGDEEGGESSGRSSHGVVDLVKSVSVAGLMPEEVDQFKSSMATTTPMGCWSVGDMHEDFWTVINNVRTALLWEWR
jgi:hypothetical protein